MPDEPYYVKGPTHAERLRQKAEKNWDPQAMQTKRWVLIGGPLIRLWEVIAGKRIAQQMGLSVRIGMAVMQGGGEHITMPNTHPQDREVYDEVIERLKKRLSEQGEAYARANEAARRGENLARALRAVDGLIDDRGNEKRHQKENL